MGKKYRKHSWRKYTPTKDEWEEGIMQAFKCHRCGTLAFAEPSFLKKINRPKYWYYKNPHVQIYQEHRRRLNSRLNNWVVDHLGPSSVNCDLVPVAEIMEC